MPLPSSATLLLVYAYKSCEVNMSHLSHEEKLEYTDLFLRVNEQFGKGDGALTIEEFEKFLIMCGFRLPKEIVAAKFAENDTDGNWKITLDEFLAKMPNIVPSQSALSVAAKIRRKYNEFDITEDGFITYEELKQVLSQKGSVDEEWLRSFVKEWDKDGDGKINFEEFLIMYLKTVILDESVQDSEKDAETMVQRLTELILSSDKMRRLCNEKDLIKAGVVAAQDLKSLMSGVKVQLTEDQFNKCIKELGGEKNGKVNLEEFIRQYEDIITKSYDEEDASNSGANQDIGKKDGGSGEDVAEALKVEVVAEGKEDGKNSSTVDKDKDDVKPHRNVKGMVDKLEKMAL